MSSYGSVFWMISLCFDQKAAQENGILRQGRREGVKGVTVSWGPDLIRGPENHENKRKTG
jgi:hypothetical protein